MTTLSIDNEFQLPADDWFHIAPTGEFDHASGVRQVVDDTACAAMVEAFADESQDPHFPGLLVDFDHFSHTADKTSAAAGWIIALKAEPTGLWAQVRWSDLGEAAVRGGRYRLVSPVWNRSECEVISPVSETNPEKLRPLRLARVALTNDPNLKGLVPLTNRSEHESTMNYKIKLLELLGLKTEANDAEIESAATAQRQESQTLQQRYGALLAARVEDDLREFATVIGDIDSVRAQLLANREATLQTLKSLRMAPSGTPAARTRLHNRVSARVPEAIFSSEKSPAEEARARRIANRARELQKQLGVGHTQAFQLAQREVA